MDLLGGDSGRRRRLRGHRHRLLLHGVRLRLRRLTLPLLPLSVVYGVGEKEERGLDFGGFGKCNGANIRSPVISRMDLEGEGFEGFPFHLLLGLGAITSIPLLLKRF